MCKLLLQFEINFFFKGTHVNVEYVDRCIMQIRIQSGADIPCGRNFFESKQQENFFQISLNIKVRQSFSCAHHNAIFGMGVGCRCISALILNLGTGTKVSGQLLAPPTGIMKGGGQKLSANLERKKSFAPACSGTTIP